MIHLLLPIALLLVAPAQLVFSQSFTQSLRVNDDAAGTRQAAPAMAVARDSTIHVVWSDFATNPDGDIRASRSTDGGRTFSPKVTVWKGGAIPSGMQRGVKLAIDTKGWLHLVWMGWKNGYDIYYSRSTDRGATFSPAVQVSGDGGMHNQDFPSIAIDSSDNISIAFIDDRDKASGTSSNTQLYFTRSTDGGTTFSPPIRASNMPDGIGGSCECCNTSIAASPDGDISIAFRSNINNRRDIFIARSIDGGMNFQTAIPAASQQWIIPACPMTGSSIALDRWENLHLVWRDSRQAAGGRNYVYYTQLRNGDASCMNDIRLSQSGKSNFPSISVTPEGAIICAYEDLEAGASDILYTYSLDGGNTFTPTTPLLNEIPDTRQELADTEIGVDGTRLVVWQDFTRDDGDIRVARDTSQLQVVLPGPVQPMLPQRGAELQSFESFLWSPPSNLGTAANVLYDLMYQTAGKQAEVRGLRSTFYSLLLEPGVYRWWVSARTTIGSSRTVDTMTFTVLEASSVDEEITTGALNIHPNPVESGERVSIVFTIPRLAHRSDVEVSVLDLLGRECLHQLVNIREAGEYQMMFSTEGLASGVYHILLHHHERTSRTTLVVVR